MRKDKKYQISSESGDPADQIFSGADIHWEKSKEELWQDLSGSIRAGEKIPEIKGGVFLRKQWIAMAASLALLLAIGSYLRFYSLEHLTTGSESLSIILPEGSSVELNEESLLSYHPYWWKISRRVKMEGEAWFRVEKGSNFSVISPQAVTEVLGTSFNVLARKNLYHVSCFSGKVSISVNQSGEQAVLVPGKQVKVKAGGTLDLSDMDYLGNKPGWLDRKILFSSASLLMVFEEIERLYGIEIATSGIDGLIYSGNFSTDIPLENVLTLLCRPFNLRYEKITGKKYLIYPDR